MRSERDFAVVTKEFPSILICKFDRNRKRDSTLTGFFIWSVNFVYEVFLYDEAKIDKRISFIEN